MASDLESAAAGLSDEGLSAVWGHSLLVSNPNPRGWFLTHSQALASCS